MTYLDLITAAYRLRNVIDESEVPSSEQGVAALEILNQMMAEWDSEGVKLQYVPTEPPALAETLSIPAYSRSGVTAMLAVRLAAGGAPSAELVSQADSGYAAILRRAVANELRPQQMDHIPAGEAFAPRGDFFTR